MKIFTVYTEVRRLGARHTTLPAYSKLLHTHFKCPGAITLPEMSTAQFHLCTNRLSFPWRPPPETLPTTSNCSGCSKPSLQLRLQRCSVLPSTEFGTSLPGRDARQSESSPPSAFLFWVASVLLWCPIPQRWDPCLVQFFPLSWPVGWLVGWFYHCSWLCFSPSFHESFQYFIPLSSQLRCSASWF